MWVVEAAVTGPGVCGCSDPRLAPQPRQHALFFLGGLFLPSVRRVDSAELVSSYLFCFLLEVLRVAL